MRKSGSTVAPRALSPALVLSALALAACGLAGCVIPERDAAREVLDEETGTTLTAMGSALEFYSPRPELGLQAASFALVGAFESNRMGVRRLMLWLSVLPGGSTEEKSSESDRPQGLAVIADGVEITPRAAGNDARELGLGGPPFKRPADWARDAYFDVTLDDLRRVADASSLALAVTSADGTVQRYEVWKPERASLARFIETLARQPPLR